jgi:hypothetical protein
MNNRQERYPGYNENNLTDISTNETNNVRYKLVNKKEEDIMSENFCSVCTELTKKDCPFCNVGKVVSHVKEVLEVMKNDTRNKVKTTIVDLSQMNIQNAKPNIVEQYDDTVNENGSIHKVQVIMSDNATINSDADVIVIFNKKTGVVNLPVISGASKIEDNKLMMGKMIVIKAFGASQVIKVQNGEKIIDGGLNAIKVEAGGKKNLLSVGKNWITI